MVLVVPRPEVNALAVGANSPAQSAIITNQQMYTTQANNNAALAGGKKKRGGGTGTPVQPLRVSYTEVATGNNSVNAQYVNTAANGLQATENGKGDAGAFKTGGRRRRTGKRKTKKHGIRKTRRRKNRH